MATFQLERLAKVLDNWTEWAKNRPEVALREPTKRIGGTIRTRPHPMKRAIWSLYLACEQAGQGEVARALIRERVLQIMGEKDTM